MARGPLLQLSRRSIKTKYPELPKYACSDVDELEFLRDNRISCDARDFYRQDLFFDVTIEFVGQEIKAHRIVLATQSNNFRKLLATNVGTEVELAML